MNERNADVSKTLTDKWKKGELPDGFYWLEFQDGEVSPTTFSIQHGFIWCDCLCDYEKIKRIIAKMPSYEEWDKLNNACHELEKETACLTVDIVKLKELLKECEHMIIAYSINNNTFTKEEIKNIISKIDQVLGEE